MEFPFYWLARLNAQYALKMEVELKKVNMNTSRWRVAMLLKEHGELSITDLATHAISKLPTITKIVYKMKDEGLVNVEALASDGRVTIVSITKKGYESVESVISQTEKLFDRAFDGFTETQIKKLNAQLQKLFNNLSDN